MGVLGGVVSALGASYVLPTSRHYSIVTVLRVCADPKLAPTVMTPHSELQDFRGEVLPNHSLLSVEAHSLGKHAVALSTSDMIGQFEAHSSDSFRSLPR